MGGWADGRIGVAAYRRIGVSAYRRALHHSVTPRPGFEDEDENEALAARKAGLAIRKNVN
jgi:hypothetical protein